MTGTAQGQQPGQAAKPPLNDADLALVDDRLEDEIKTPEEIWNEIEAGEVAAAGKTADADGKSKDQEAGAEDGDEPSQDSHHDAQAPAAAKDAAAQAAAEDADDAEGDEEPPGGGDDAAAGQAAGARGEQQGEDPWSDAPPKLKAAYEQSQTALKRLEQSERSNRGRVSTLQRQLNELSSKLNGGAPGTPGTVATSSEASRTNAVQQFLESPEWKAVQEEYPELGAPLGKLAKLINDEQATTRKSVATIQEDRRLAAREEQTDLLEEQHSDWQSVAADSAYGVVDDGTGEPTILPGSWVDQQPRYVQQAALRNAKGIVDAAEAADLVGRFKAFRSSAQPHAQANRPGQDQDDGTTGSLSARRKRQLESSGSVRTRGRAAAQGIPEDGDPETLWNMFEEKDAREAASG